MNMYLPNTSAIVRMSISKQKKADLNSEFSFSKTGYLTQVKESSISNGLPTADEEKQWVFMLCQRASACKQPCPRFEPGSPIPFPTMITVMLSAPLGKNIKVPVEKYLYLFYIIMQFYSPYRFKSFSSFKTLFVLHIYHDSIFVFIK